MKVFVPKSLRTSYDVLGTVWAGSAVYEMRSGDHS